MKSTKISKRPVSQLRFEFSNSHIQVRIITFRYSLQCRRIPHEIESNCLPICIQLSPSWESNGLSATQQFFHILCNPKVYYHFHKSAPPVLTLKQANWVHNLHVASLTSVSVLSFHLSLIVPCCFFPSGFSIKPNTHSFLSHSRYIPCPSHPYWFYQSNCIRRWVQFIKFLFL